MRAPPVRSGREAVDAALVMSLASIAAACIGVAILLCASLVWTDLLHANAGRTASETLETMLVSPISGLVLGVLWFALPVAVGGVFAGAVIFAQGRLSRTGFVSVAAVATAFFVWSWISTPPAIDDVSGEVLGGPEWCTLVYGSALMIVSLYAGWQYHRRRLTAREARPMA